MAFKEKERILWAAIQKYLVTYKGEGNRFASDFARFSARDNEPIPSKKFKKGKGEPRKTKDYRKKKNEHSIIYYEWNILLWDNFVFMSTLGY